MFSGSRLAYAQFGVLAAAPMNRKHDVTRFFVGWLGALVTAATVALLYRLARALDYGERAALGLAALYGLATAAWPYARTFFAEPLTALLLLAAFYALVNGMRRAACGVRNGRDGAGSALGQDPRDSAFRTPHSALVLSGIAAGAALSLFGLKPQLAFLVPVALLVAGHYRMLAGLAIAGGLLAAASLLIIGAGGAGGWVAAIQAASRVGQEAYSLRGWLGTSPWVLGLEAAAAGAALVAAWRHSENLALILGAAVVGSLLATPYLHLQDLSLLLPVGWLAWAAQPSVALRRFATAGWLAVNLALLSGVAAVLVEAAWISWLAAGPSPRCRSRPGPR